MEGAGTKGEAGLARNLTNYQESPTIRVVTYSLTSAWWLQVDKRLGSGKVGIKSEKKEDVGVPGRTSHFPECGQHFVIPWLALWFSFSF